MKSAKLVYRRTQHMNTQTAAKSTAPKRKLISLADERKRQEIRELVKMFEQFYERKVKP